MELKAFSLTLPRTVGATTEEYYGATREGNLPGTSRIFGKRQDVRGVAALRSSLPDDGVAEELGQRVVVAARVFVADARDLRRVEAVEEDIGQQIGVVAAA